MRLLKLLALPVFFLFYFILPTPASTADFSGPVVSGPVVSVLDGDTLEVQHNRHSERIRLSGIDCPEKGQAYGKKAKQSASALVFGKQITLQTHGLDKYGRSMTNVSGCWGRLPSSA